MDHASVWFIITITSVVSSTLTALLVYLLVRSMYRRKIKKRLHQLPTEIGLKVEEGVKKAGESLLPEFEKRVRAGFRSALKDVTSLGPEITTSAIEAGIQSIDSIFRVATGSKTDKQNISKNSKKEDKK